MQSAKILSVFFSLAIVLPASAADQQHAAFTCVDAAGIDYQIQGEYEGTSEDEPYKVGAQVIALGGGKFEVKGFPGGLPGAGWSRGDKVHQADRRGIP